MSLYTQFFNDVVFVHRFSSINSSGDITYNPELVSSPVNVLCRVEYSNKEIIDKNGNKVTSAATLYADVPIDPLSIVKINNTTHTVIACTPIADLYGNIDHYEINV